MKLKKDQINNIKYFIRNEVEQHKYLCWADFEITWLKIHVDGFYSFRVKWKWTTAGVFENFNVEGNMFEEFPIAAICDELDVAQMIIFPIRKKAYERQIKHMQRDLDRLKENSNHIYNHIYKLDDPNFENDPQWKGGES